MGGPPTLTEDRVPESGPTAAPPESGTSIAGGLGEFMGDEEERTRAGAVPVLLMRATPAAQE